MRLIVKTSLLFKINNRYNQKINKAYGDSVIDLSKNNLFVKLHKKKNIYHDYDDLNNVLDDKIFIIKDMENNNTKNIYLKKQGTTSLKYDVNLADNNKIYSDDIIKYPRYDGVIGNQVNQTRFPI